MSKYTQHYEYLGITGIVTAPLAGDQAARLITLNAAALARGAVLLPAKGGDLYFKFGWDDEVDAAGDNTDDGCIIHGESVLVKIPSDETGKAGWLSVQTTGDDEFDVVAQVIN